MFFWRSLLSCFHITGYKINWMSLFFQPFDCLFQCLLAFTIWLESVNIVCPLYVMCHFSLALLLITSFFIVASCRLTVMFWVFPIWDLWWVLDVLLNITKCEFFFFFYYFKYFFLPLYPFFLQGPSLHMHRHLILYQESNILFIWVNNFLFLQMGYFLLTYFQHWFWCWAPLVSFSFQLLNFQLYSFFFIVSNSVIPNSLVLSIFLLIYWIFS